MLSPIVSLMTRDSLSRSLEAYAILCLMASGMELIGACFYDGYEEVSFDQLYRKADRAMYQSKKQKGCSAVIYGEEM